MAYSLAKSERLNKRDFQKRKWEKRDETVHFTYSLSRMRQAEKKIGVTVPKKTGKAVSRNRVKRIVREFYRYNKGLFRDDHHHLIRIRKMPDPCSLHEVSIELTALIARSPKQ